MSGVDGSDRLFRAAHITAMADTLFGNDEKAKRWLSKPKDRFSEKSPMAMLEILVRLEVDQEDFPETQQLLKVEIHGDVSIAPAAPLKPDWTDDLRHTKGLGDALDLGAEA